MELVLTGRSFGAEDARLWGLVNAVVDDGSLVSAARDLAGQIAGNAPPALAASKRILDESPDWPAAEAFARQAEITEPVFASADALEGARAFTERRAPRWQGR